MAEQDEYMTAGSRAALQSHPSMQAAEDILHDHKEEEQRDEAERQYAAAQIQKAWRKRMRKKYLDPGFLWTDLATEARMQVGRFSEDCKGCMEMTATET